MKWGTARTVSDAISVVLAVWREDLGIGVGSAVLGRGLDGSGSKRRDRRADQIDNGKGERSMGARGKCHWIAIRQERSPPPAGTTEGP